MPSDMVNIQFKPDRTYFWDSWSNMLRGTAADWPDFIGKGCHGKKAACNFCGELSCKSLGPNQEGFHSLRDPGESRNWAGLAEKSEQPDLYYDAERGLCSSE